VCREVLEVEDALDSAPWNTGGMDDLIRRFYEDLWNRWDDAAVDDLLSEGFIFRGSLGTDTVGRDGWRAYRDVVRAGANDFHNEVITLVVDGPTAAARLWYTGTHSGKLAGLEPTGRRFSYAGAAFFTADGQRLTSAWVLGDLAGLRAQLS
jgi:predicted ester cyclase